MLCGLSSLEEVFKTEKGAVLQCNNKNCYWLDFAGDCTPFKVADFLLLKKTVEQIDLQNMLINTSRGFDFTILMPFRSSRCFVLDATDLINLRDLLRGALFMMEINGVIKECLKGVPMHAC